MTVLKLIMKIVIAPVILLLTLEAEIAGMPRSIVNRANDILKQLEILLNPALQEAADYTCQVAADIVSRYDIDGFHHCSDIWNCICIDTCFISQ